MLNEIEMKIKTMKKPRSKVKVRSKLPWVDIKKKNGCLEVGLFLYPDYKGFEIDDDVLYSLYGNVKRNANSLSRGGKLILRLATDKSMDRVIDETHPMNGDIRTMSVFVPTNELHDNIDYDTERFMVVGQWTNGYYNVSDEYIGTTEEQDEIKSILKRSLYKLDIVLNKDSIDQDYFDLFVIYKYGKEIIKSNIATIDWSAWK